ncbi:uncharacterized protein LOC131874109 [Cryptomeria japonica]|uniref:uncharacterized protein LOC131874109 n=1 Tax=Cryptomeria japonica TaxID=3369 RepID=UPI0027DA8492|nr:uncharacterized protein LOC131874109 [Cryptomeria japonica]
MGLVGYNHRLVQGFSRIDHPITSLQRRGNKFVWSKKCEATFQTLKEHLTSAPILAVPNPVGDFVVCTNASLKGLGIVLKKDGRVIAHESHKFEDHELNYPTNNLELATVVHSLGKENVVADVLSSRRHELSTMALIVDLRSQILSALPLDIWY